MENYQEIDIDNIVINLIESLKSNVFILGIPSCIITIDSIMGELVDTGLSLNTVTTARLRIYDMFIDFCLQNIGMLAIASTLEHFILSQESKVNKNYKLNKNGYLYAAKITDGMIKIGRSKNPNARLRSMQDKGRLKFIETFVSNLITDYVEAEISIHKIFSKKRRTGEWFDITFEEAVLQIKKTCQ